MRKLLWLLPIVLVLTACDATPLPAAGGGAPLPTTRVLLASPTAPATLTPPPGVDGVTLALTANAAQAQAAQAQAAANAAAAQAQAAGQAVLAVTAQAAQTRTAYAEELQRRADDLADLQAHIAISATASAATATQVAVLRLQEAAERDSRATAVSMARIQQGQAVQAALDATAVAAQATRTAQAADIAVQSARMWQQGTVIAGLVLLFGGIGLALYALYSWLHGRALRGAVIETRAGTAIVRHVDGRLEVELLTPPLLTDGGTRYGPDGEFDEFESQAAVAEPVPYTSSGRPADLSPETLQAAADRRLVLRLLRDAIAASEASATKIPRWDALGWTSADTWTRATDLLLPHIVKRAGRYGGTFLRQGAYSTLVSLYDAVGNRRVALGTALPGAAGPDAA